MALREFLDKRGRRWTVWDVYSTMLHRDPMNIDQSAGAQEQAAHRDQHARVSQRTALDWLAFEAHDGERRRLTPIPPCETHWFDAPEQQLCTWCDLAKQVPPTRRLIE